MKKRNNFVVIHCICLLVFSAGCDKTDEITLPILTTTEASNIFQTIATSGGNISSDGGATVTSRGVCWSIQQTPTVLDSKTTDSTGIGSFISNLTDLKASTTYYVRAYANNSIGTVYGNQQTFTTPNHITLLAEFGNSLFEYDNYNRLAKRKIEGWVDVDHYQYNYDTKGRLSAIQIFDNSVMKDEIRFIWIDNTLKIIGNDYKIVYEFDTNGLVRKEISGSDYSIFIWENGNIKKIVFYDVFGKSYGSNTYNYDNNNNPFYGLGYVFGGQMDVFGFGYGGNNNTLCKNNVTLITATRTGVSDYKASCKYAYNVQKYPIKLTLKIEDEHGFTYDAYFGYTTN